MTGDAPSSPLTARHGCAPHNLPAAVGPPHRRTFTPPLTEAKYGSKLSASTSNNDGQHGYPADQLIRNVRVGLHECGYYKTPRLFESTKRDFAVLVLSPERGQPLVTTYRDEATLRTSIPHSEKIEQFQATPFVGELGYADILQTLKSRYRFLSRVEQRLTDVLSQYLEFKNAHRPR